MAGIWLVGSEGVAPPEPLGTDQAPRRLLFTYAGIRSASQNIDYGYPFFCDESEICGYNGRIVQFKVVYTYELSGTISGQTASVSGGGTSLVMALFGTTDERTSVLASTNQLGSQGGYSSFVTADQDEHADVTINGVTDSFTGTNGWFINVASYAGFNTPPSPAVPYYFRTDTGAWLPRIEAAYVGLVPWFSNADSAVDPSGAVTPGFQVLSFNGSWTGPVRWTKQAGNLPSITNPFEIRFITGVDLNLDSASCDVTVDEYWPYDADGTGPIYDTSTGFVLDGKTPITPVRR